MHMYLRAIGFSSLSNRKKLKELLHSVIQEADRRAYTINQGEILLGDFCKDFAEGLGIAVCGEFDEDDKFVYEYYYPYLIGSGVTTHEEVFVERHVDKDSFAGVCEDTNISTSIIFYLRDRISYLKMMVLDMYPVSGSTLTLAGLSTSGTIMMPILKNEKQKKQINKTKEVRHNLLKAAQKGDTDAMDTLFFHELDQYNVVINKLQRQDVYSLVDTYFMPYGAECDQYSVLGEIVNMRKVINRVTDEEIYILTICCNELTFDVCINIIDLFGEPEVGRRFKGVVWLQGFINFPEEIQ